MLAMHNNQEDDVITGALPELPGVGATFKTQFISRSWEEFPRKYFLVWGLRIWLCKEGVKNLQRRGSLVIRGVHTILSILEGPEFF